MAAHAALLVFSVGTYSLIPVRGFGAILCVMGIAATHRNDALVRAAYLAVAGFIFLFSDWFRMLIAG